MELQPYNIDFIVITCDVSKCEKSNDCILLLNISLLEEQLKVLFKYMRK